MKNFYLLSALFFVLLVIGTGCQNKQAINSLPPAASIMTTQAEPETQAESASKAGTSKLNTEPYKPKKGTPVSIGTDFRITNIGNSNTSGDPIDSVFPIFAYVCDSYEIEDGIERPYSRIDFFIAENEANTPAILLGTTPGGSSGSGECDLRANESRLETKLKLGEYRIWAIRYIENKPDKRTPDFIVTLQ